jgi:hypothetical protein
MAGSPKPSDSVGVRAYPFSTDLPHNVFDRASEANHESIAICMSCQTVIDHLLQLPMPASPQFNIPTVYSVKVYDARVGPPSKYSGGESESHSDAESEDPDREGLEG